MTLTRCNQCGMVFDLDVKVEAKRKLNMGGYAFLQCPACLHSMGEVDERGKVTLDGATRLRLVFKRKAKQ